MVKEQATSRQQRLEKFLQAVEAAQKLQDDILKYGLDAAYLYCDDVDGDWLEKWGKDEEEQKNYTELITVFLQSDDLVAVTLKKHLQEKSLPEITLELERCLSLPEEDRIFAIKDLLVNNLTRDKSNQADNINNEIDLMDLAQSLLKKLENIHKFNYLTEI